MMKSITEAGNLKGKRVLVRVDWSVPTQNGEVMNDYQIQKSLPTIEYLREAGAKITLISHAERDADSLEPIYKHVKEFLPALTFVKPSNLVLLENLRQNKGEKENSKEFDPKRPFLFILGGAKFDTKLPLLKKFVNIADYIFVGGALAHNFFKELGRDIGDSLVSNGDFGLKELLDTGKIILPSDTIVEDKKIMDAGPVTMENLKLKIRSSQLVLWNGPLGSYERGYRTATLQLAKLIAESGRESIIGGGDTLAAVKELNLFDKFSFVSTGGGAMLEFLATGTLPGIEALSKKQ